jgi:hypothetical protein
MKKLVNVLALLSLASCFSLVACGDDDDTKTPGVTAGQGGQNTVGGSAVAGGGSGARGGGGGRGGSN